MGRMKTKVLHLTEGLVWAGMESHIYNLLIGFDQSEVIDAECITLHSGLLSKRLAKKGIQTDICLRRKKIDFKFFLNLIKLLKCKQPDIINLHGYLAILYGIPASYFANIPARIVTLHAKGEGRKNKLLPSKMNIYLWLAYFLIKISKAYCIAVSKDVRDRHIEFRDLSCERTIVIHNGIAIQAVQKQDLFISKYDLNISDSDFVVGMVGRIDDNKGHIYLLKAVREILKVRECVHFVIIGNGPTEKQLKEYCVETQIDSHVHFLGYQENVLDYLSLLDVMVIASKHEGIPYVLLEAMANEVPVITTDVGGLPEVIQDNYNGLMVPSQNSVAIKDKIIRLIENSDLRKQLTKNATNILNTDFSSDVMTQTTIKFYKKVLDTN